MELIKKQIHMNRWKGNAVTQITLDEDFIVPDTLEDMEPVSYTHLTLPTILRV